MDFFKKASEAFGDDQKKADLMKQAEGFVAAHQKKAEEKTGEEKTAAAPASESASTATEGDPKKKQGYNEVIGSAQTLYQGLQDKLSGKKDVDDAKLAGAAEAVLKAADNAGFGKNTQYGDYLTKAEDYLHNYGAKGSHAPTSGDAAATQSDAVPPTPTDK